MNRIGFVIVAVLACMSLQLFGEDSTVDLRKSETILKADKLFGQRYIATAGKPLQLYDEDTETGPPAAVLYWHGSSYIVELIFAADGTVAQVALLPEALLHRRYWGDVPDIVELSRAEMQWLVASANALQPLGNVSFTSHPPDRCFQSGQNLYCADTYELAHVSHYHQQRGKQQITEARDIVISYRQFVSGIVEDVNWGEPAAGQSR